MPAWSLERISFFAVQWSLLIITGEFVTSQSRLGRRILKILDYCYVIQSAFARFLKVR